MEESFEKPSFLIYNHDFNSISYFSDELLGLLFRTICEYQNDKKAHIDVDPRIKQAPSQRIHPVLPTERGRHFVFPAQMCLISVEWKTEEGERG